MENSVDAFDDEPTTGGGYERVVELPLLIGDEVARRVIVRFRGRPLERVSVVLEEVRNGERGVLMRYDDAHGRFHRHAPGWPKPGKIEAFLDDVPVRQRAVVADNEIRARYTAWEADLFDQKGGDQP